MACALEVLERTTGRLWERLLVGRGPVPDPLLLRTHPATQERTRRLRELEPGDGDDDGDPWHGASRQRPSSDYPRIVDPPRLRRPGIRW